MSEQNRPVFQSVEAVQAQFAQWNYIADRALALTVKLAADLEKPLKSGRSSCAGCRGFGLRWPNALSP